MGRLVELRSVSVLVAVRNGEHSIARQLEALSRQDYEGSWEIIAADNGSTDGTRALLEEWCERMPNLRVVDASRRRGSAAARNAAAAAAIGELLLSCDADDEVSADWVSAMARALHDRPIVAGPTIYLDDNGVEEMRSHGAHMYLRKYPVALCASFGVRREVFDRIGGFDTTVEGSSGTDMEFSVRASRLGYQVGFADAGEIVKSRRDGVVATYRQYLNYGRGGAWIFQRHRDLRLWRLAIRDNLRNLGWMLRHLGEVRSAMGRRRWVRWLARTHGWAVGRWQHRHIEPYVVREMESVTPPS
jgi:glycosyltransferase involved in cell wall biosynthesis